MDRRRFLAAAAAGAAAAMSGIVTLDRRHAADPEVPDAAFPLLASLGPDAVAALGRRYRELTPAEADAAALRAALRTAPRRSGVPAGRAAAEDFAAGRVVVLDGWLLALSEARRCALHSLVAT